MTDPKQPPEYEDESTTARAIRLVREDGAKKALAEVADWLVDMGYPNDWSSEYPPPKALWWPIAHAWWRRESTSEPDITPQQFYDWCSDEGGWSHTGSEEADRG